MSIETIISARINEAIANYNWENLIRITLDNVNFEQMVADMIEMNLDISDQVESYIDTKIEEHLEELDLNEIIEELPW